MDCNFMGDCDGEGVVRCECECELCMTTADHQAECEGCDACESNPNLCEKRGHLGYIGTGDDPGIAYVERCSRGGCEYARPVTVAQECAERGHPNRVRGLDDRYDVCPACQTTLPRSEAVAS